MRRPRVGYRPLCVPLVNVRATLDFAVARGDLNAAAADALLAAARSLYFKDRTWRRVVESAAGAADRLPDPSWLAANTIDQKAMDARALIDAMLALAADWPGPFRSDFLFEPTDAWDDFVASQRAAPLAAFDELVLDEARLLGADFETLLLAASAIVSARTGQAQGTRLATSSEVDAFRRRHELYDTQRYEDWLASAGLDARQLRVALGGRAALTDLADTSFPELAAALLQEIKLRGLYPDLPIAPAGRRQCSMPTLAFPSGLRSANGRCCWIGSQSAMPGISAATILIGFAALWHFQMLLR